MSFLIPHSTGPTWPLWDTLELHHVRHNVCQFALFQNPQHIVGLMGQTLCAFVFLLLFHTLDYLGHSSSWCMPTIRSIQAKYNLRQFAIQSMVE